MFAGLALVALVAVACASTAQKSSSPTTSATPGKPGPGVTATSISVGISYTASSNPNGNVGAGGVTVGNEKADAQIVIDDINAHGGVAGRKLVPTFYKVPATTTAQQDEQAECASFTQDHPVFAVLGSGSHSFLTCMNDAGVVVIDDDLVAYGQVTYQQYPHYIEATQFNLDRIAATLPQALSAQNYFTPWDTTTGAPGGSASKVGIVTFDTPDFAHAVDQVLVPGLAKAGYTNPDIVRVTSATTTAEVNDLTAALKSAVLRFRTDHVDHVILLEEAGLLALFFAKDAQTQGYFPRYSAATNSGFQALIDGAGLPKDQMQGAVGFGWNPVLDLPYSQNPITGPYSNDARRHCRQLMVSHGQRFPDANAEAVANSYCTELYLLRDALKGQTGSVNADTFLTGLNALGSSFQGASSFGTHFGPDQHDGGSGYYYWAYKESCGCFGYTGTLHHAD